MRSAGLLALIKDGGKTMKALISKVESSYCHYLEMLKLRKNKKNDLYMFFVRREFQEDPVMEPLREIAWRSYGI